MNLFEIEGMVKTVVGSTNLSFVTSKNPTKVEQQFFIYLDQSPSPTTKRLYAYSNKSNSWYYVALT